jgi:glycosyltransferase involved in cell wall biosynthesis
MRILVVNKFFWPKGGSERVMFDLIDGYRAAGHEVVPFAMRSERNVGSPHERHFVPEVDYGRLSALGAVRAGLRAVWSGEARKRIVGLVREVRPHVAHLHNFHHQLSPSIVDGLATESVPAVHTLHDYQVICPNYLLYTEGAPCERCRGGRFHEAVRHRCVRGSRAASAVAAADLAFHRWRGTLEKGIAAFVSPSRFLRDKLVEFGVSPDRVRVVPNGLDPGDIEPADAPGRGFLYAGRLAREKGVGTLVDAVGRAEGLRLTVAGTGPEEKALRRRAEEIAPERIRFVGHLGRDELLATVRAARAVVMPSEWYENAPMSALEALASGVPVVATRLGGLPEMVRDGETGLLVAPGDPDGLGAALRRLEDDSGLAAQLGRRGREVVETEYTRSEQVATMLDLLSEVASCASR